MSKTKLGPFGIIGLVVLGIGLAPIILPLIWFVIFLSFFAGGFKVFRIMSGCDDEVNRPPERRYDDD
ncbi:MAG: hypothetical protein GX075_11585 [Firmicutes bacterium]|nr:hypothetical protein [Bacillota bacterium]